MFLFGLLRLSLSAKSNLNLFGSFFFTILCIHKDRFHYYNVNSNNNHNNKKNRNKNKNKNRTTIN